MLAGMSRITPEEVVRTARLARLRLRPEEIAPLTGQLERVLDYAALLDEVDTEGIPPTAHALALHAPQRGDAPGTPLSAEAALANAPERAGECFAVPEALDAEQAG